MKLVVTGSNGSTISFQEGQTVGSKTMVTVEFADTGDAVINLDKGFAAQDSFLLDELLEAIDWMKKRPNNWGHQQHRGGTDIR